MGRGYFGVAVDHPKTSVNVGTLWRSATLYGAAFVATVGYRYARQPTDTVGTPWHTPLLHYTDLDDLIGHLPFSCPLVGVELTPAAVSLPELVHPLRALYLLGAEDHGLSRRVLDRCHYVVRVPSLVPQSLNVAVAGSIVLYDRFTRGVTPG